MGRKKKRRSQDSRPKPRASSAEDGFGTLAAKLKAANVAPPDDGPTAVDRYKRQAPPEPVRKPTRKVSEADLMREAFEAAGQGGLIDKFGNAGYDAGDVEVVDKRRQAEPEPVPVAPDGLTDEDLLFFEAVGGDVRPMERDKLADLKGRDWVGARWATEHELTTLTPEELKEPRLTGEQRDRLRRSRKGPTMNVLNIRRLKRREAMAEVEAFVAGARADGDRFVRIVTGKGKQSAGDPVLKPAVIKWCHGPGSSWVAGWAPETDRSGQYGSVVLELRRTKR